MTNYEKFMKLLHDKGHVKAMNVAVNMTPLIDTFLGDRKDELLKGCTARYITTVLARDSEIKQAFDRAACDLMLNEIVEDLDLKKDENFEPTQQDILAKSLADVLLNSMFRK